MSRTAVNASEEFLGEADRRCPQGLACKVGPSARTTDETRVSKGVNRTYSGIHLFVECADVADHRFTFQRRVVVFGVLNGNKIFAAWLLL